MFANPYQAAQYGYIDDVIEPRNTVSTSADLPNWQQSVSHCLLKTRMHADVTIIIANRKLIITMANKDKNIYAAIALALHEFSGNNVHDKEPGIDYNTRAHTLWNAKYLSMTAKP